VRLQDFTASGSLSISPRTAGLICHDKRYLSLSQPHFTPPALEVISTIEMALKISGNFLEQISFIT
jgi:hypothetical protein